MEDLNFPVSDKDTVIIVFNHPINFIYSWYSFLQICILKMDLQCCEDFASRVKKRLRKVKGTPSKLPLVSK